jgi:hypothetical protein
MRRVAFIPVLLVMASVASSASVAASGERAQINDRITSASNLPDVKCHVRSLSQRNATQPTIVLPRFNPDPTPIITEFYGPAKPEAKKPEPKPASAAVPEAAVHTTTPSIP